MTEIAFSENVAGTTFAGAPIAEINPGDHLVMIPEPCNEHDPNAVVVLWRGMAIGYLPRKRAAKVSGMLAAGAASSAYVRECGRSNGHPYVCLTARITIDGK